MEKPSQVLLIDPPTELRFQGPFDKMVATEINLKNPSDKKVCFKVKTTAPKRYFVRPNSGIIDPSKSELVKVSLQALDSDADRAKHKFMVQSVYLPDGFNPIIDDIWKVAKPDQLMESKLKCVFDDGVDAKETSPVANKDVESEPITVAVSPEKLREEPVYSKSTSTDPSAEVTRLQTELREAENKIKNLMAELTRREAENTHLRAEQRELRQRYMERSRQEEAVASGDKGSLAAATPPDSTSSARQVITFTPQHLTLFALVIFFMTIVFAKLFM